jgi:hypothetical protein
MILRALLMVKISSLDALWAWASQSKAIANLCHRAAAVTANSTGRPRMPQTVVARLHPSSP